MSEKNSFPNLLLAASWRDVLRMVGSKAKHDARTRIVPVTFLPSRRFGEWLVKTGEKLRANR